MQGASQYHWKDGFEGPSREINDRGSYSVTATIENCQLEDEINIFFKDCQIALYIPNAFSPNNDLINDLFEIYGQDTALEELLIFNRWGGIVFETNTIPFAWDGNKNGKPAQEGVYVYLLKYKNLLLGNKHILSGEITLLKQFP